MPSYEFTGADPIDHFHLGRVEPGDIAEFDEQPPGPWKATRKRARTSPSTEHGSDDPNPAEEG